MIRDDWTLLNETASKSDEQVEGAMTQSTLFNALLQCAQEAQDEDISALRLWSPMEILDADVFPEALQTRFRENERESIKTELEAEQEKLATYIEKGRLEVHFEGLISAARDLVRMEADQAGDEAAQHVADETTLTIITED